MIGESGVNFCCCLFIFFSSSSFLFIFFPQKATLRTWYATCRWHARRRGKHSLKQSSYLPLLRPTVWQTWRSSSLDPIMPRSSWSGSAAMKRRCMRQPSSSLTTSPTLPALPPLLYTLGNSRMQWTLRARLTPPEPGRK